MTQLTAIQVFRYSRWMLALLGLLTALGPDAAQACDTPVYRYAMYRWEPAPYEIYYFHDQPIDEEAAKLHKVIDEVSKSEEQPANLFFVAVDVKADPELKTIPRDVRQWWQEQEDAKTPCYAVVTPYGLPIHHGDLDEAALKTLLDSPARRETLKQLTDGKAGVMMLVTGSDDKANGEAEKLIKEFVADIASGKIELYLPPGAGFFGPPPEGEEEEQPKPPTIEVGYVKVDRKDAKEKWLVESLLSMEEDLKDEEFVDKPMMFVVFGRGRALPPCVGKGVNRDNLLDCVDFVTGACSCTVKDQNPGMDLLFTADWYEAAETLATKYGAEEGNEYQLAAEDFFPNLIIPADQPGDDDDASTDEMPTEESQASEGSPEKEEPVDPASEAGVASSETPADSEVTSADESSESAAEETIAETVVEDEDGDAGDAPAGEGEETDHAATEIAANTTITAHEASHADGGEHSTAPDMFRGVFVVGAGVAVAFVLLFGMTFLVLRPR